MSTLFCRKKSGVSLLALLFATTALPAFAEDTSKPELSITITQGQLAKTYAAPIAASATKTPTPIEEIPQSITVIPRAVIDDQQASTLADVLRNVSSVQTVGDLEQVNATETIRGFQARHYVDGMPGYYSFSNPDSLVNIERVEVVKGPTASLFSGGVGTGIGGMINLVSKTPQRTPSYAASVTAGSFNTLNPAFDVNQPLDKDGKALFRLTGDYKYNESWIEDAFVERKSLFPTLQLNFSEDTKLVLRGQFNNRKQTDYSGLPATGTVKAASFKLRDDLLVTADGAPNTSYETQGFGGTLSHRFNKVWSASVDARYIASNFNQFSVFPFPSTPTSGSTFNVSTAYLGQDIGEFTINPQATAEFATGAVKHTVVLGADYDQTSEDGDLLFNRAGSAIDLTQPFNLAFVNPTFPFTTRDSMIKTTGLYAQDQITVWERLHLLGGLRWARIGLDDNDAATGLNSSETFYKLTPRIGAAVDVTKSIALFAGYSEGFQSILGLSGVALNTTGSIKPETSQQTEGGVKFNYAEYGLSGTWSVFEITRQNVPTADPSNPFLQVQTGEQRVRGTDIDVVWQLNDAWTVLANYAYQNGEITKDNSIPTGNALVAVPEHSGRVAVRYDVQDGKLKGLGLGAGVTAMTERKGDSSNSFETPSFATFDAQASYPLTKNVDLKLNVVNLTDEKHYEPYTFLGGAVAPNQPLSAFVTLAVKF